MYYWHKRTNENGQIRLTLDDTASLGGCNVGVIPDELSQIPGTHHSEQSRRCFFGRRQ